MSKDEKDNKKTDDKSETVKDERFADLNLPGPGPGRPKGALNKNTRELRESFRLIAENQTPKLQEALDKLFEKDPDKAIKHLLALSEYVTPKLARTEMTGADNGPVQLYLVDRIKDPEADESDDSKDT